MVEFGRLAAAHHKAQRDLLAAADAHGHWIGELASSALSTATAVSALSLAARHAKPDGSTRWGTPDGRQQLNDLILAGMRWLAEHVNPDGGWGDTDLSTSNIATTMLVRAAFHLTAVPAKHADLLTRAAEYTQAQGEIAGLRKRYGKDKTFAVPILTNCALAGMVPWRDVSALPFELACLPRGFFKFLRLPVVSYAIPALVAIGQCRFYHRPPMNPLIRWMRRRSIAKSLRVLKEMQPDSGGYLEATPLTSFVVMSLASMNLVENPVTLSGLDFLVASVRPDGSWPIDTNLATWNTTLALNALDCDVAGETAEAVGNDKSAAWYANCLDWVGSCQHRVEHPFTGAAPGGWGWSDLSGAVPDADDTASALLALAKWRGVVKTDKNATAKSSFSARAAIQWLLDLQNRDGGWPTFCRGWGALPFDRSAADLTAHAMRAMWAWRDDSLPVDPAFQIPRVDEVTLRSLQRSAIERGFAYLEKKQRADGSWVPLWFGNQHDPQEENPVYGTARVLLAYRDLQRLDGVTAKRGIAWLVEHQNADGGWGGGPKLQPAISIMASPKNGQASPDESKSRRIQAEKVEPAVVSSIEETALALETLASLGPQYVPQTVVEKGLEWLVSAVEGHRHRDCSPIGFYFAKLWYYERLYPLTFTVAALGAAVTRLRPPTSSQPTPVQHV